MSRQTRMPASAPVAKATRTNAEPSATPPTKTVALLALVSREQGTTITDITGATGWLPHSARAALTGLRKHGHTIARTSVDGVTTYRVVEQAQ